MTISTKRINQTAATVRTNGDTEVLVSYYTPVAAFVPGRGYLQTDRRYSVTTTKHVNRWIGGTSTVVPQAEIDRIAASLAS